MGRYYIEGERRAEKVGDLFATVARRYDLMIDLQSLGLHRLWKRRLVKLANVSPGQSVLDVCCGTGDVALALARHGATVHGLDFSEPMLGVARRRASALRSKAPVFQRGDAQELPFADATFSAVTIAYGLRNLADLDRGLSEMVRVLQPGGRLVALEFGKPVNKAWRWAYFQYLRWLVPVFGRVFCGDAGTHAYILESLERYPAQTGVDQRLRALGMGETRIIPILGGAMSINVGERAGG